MYQILIQYGTELSLEDTKHKTIDDAVKYAIASNFGASFQIVKVIDWKATTLKGGDTHE